MFSQKWLKFQGDLAVDTFQSLIPDARGFLSELAANNNRDWFLANKDRYDGTLKRPAELLLEQVGANLRKSLDTSVKPKLFRANRDVRFSKDKTPYHLHLHMLWTADFGGLQPVGFFFGIGLNYISVGAGLMGFEKDTLTSWRVAIDGPLGVDYQKQTENLCKGGFRIAEPELKRVPAPYAKDHPRGELLKRKSLSAWKDFEEDAISAPVKTLETVFKDLDPLVQMLGGLR